MKMGGLIPDGYLAITVLICTYIDKYAGCSFVKYFSIIKMDIYLSAFLNVLSTYFIVHFDPRTIDEQGFCADVIDPS